MLFSRLGAFFDEPVHSVPGHMFFVGEEPRSLVRMGFTDLGDESYDFRKSLFETRNPKGAL